MADWRSSAARDLPISDATSWDGAAAKDAVFSWAGWPDDPNPSRARRAFLAYDAASDEQKGAYKLPFATVADGKLVAMPAGLRNAASRLPQTDIPSDVKDRARATLDAYFARMKKDDPVPATHRTKRPAFRGVELGDLLDIRSADAATGVLAGHASHFWVVDSYGETVAPGAFATSIRERGPDGADRILLRYEHAATVGKATKIAEDDAGLAVEAMVSDDGRDGTALRRHLADGIPYGLSIGFYRKQTRPATDDDPLVLDHAPGWVKALVAADGASAVTVHTDMKLVEFSAVSFPAVETAVVEAYRADELRSLLSDLKAGRLSDEERACVQELVDAWSADGGTGGREAAPVDVTQTAMRRHDLEAALLFAQAKQWGVDVGAVA